MRPVLLLLGLVAAVSAVDPVKIHLYYETLCPYSIDFVVNQLYKTWTLVKDIMEVEMFPFGNAEYYPDGEGWSFRCQHGSGECRGNMIHACAKNHFNDINIEMEFVNCLLSADYPPNAGAKCAAEVGADWAPLEQCVNSIEGQNLLHDVAVQQEQLQPKLYFVPWIIVKDVFSEEQVGECQTNLLKVVCEKYTGVKPDACSSYPLELTSSKIGVSKF
uniref:Gamma-interferon induced thiol reductase GILT1 n=1 Tax=Scylla paramamosain TaxID=85552 RepID=A0A0K0YBC9_SCYPA|nr:gamma-interferon induced thiol reductase GILT1 [Scylla paramamosain]